MSIAPHSPGAGRTVVVVGGGIAGLAAAWELTGGAGGPDPDAPSVIVLEASDRLGGKLRVEQLGGQPVDVGPDGFLGRRPEAVTLCREIGLDEDLVPIGASGAAIWVRSRRRTLPSGLVLGVPTRFLPTARSGILGVTGSLRLLLDIVAPRRDLRGPLGDRSIGPLIAHKLGHRVVDRLVDPLVGGIHAGGVADMSAAAVFPLLLAVSQRRGGFMRSLRRVAAAGRTGAPAGGSEGSGRTGAPAGGSGGSEGSGEIEAAFWSLRGGVGSLPGRLADALTSRGVSVLTGRAVESLDRGEPAEPAWVLHTAEGPLPADGVVLALPAGPAAELLAPHDAEVATLLRGVEHASVAVVTLVYPASAVPDGLVGTGLLVPHGTPAPSEVEGGGPLMVTACSYLSVKWPHLARPGTFLLRTSVGRFGDDRQAALDDEELTTRVTSEVHALLGVEGAPTSTLVTRWSDAFPQYRVHHLLRVTGMEAAARRLPALELAGATYRGVGIPACIASGRAAARSVLNTLAEEP